MPLKIKSRITSSKRSNSPLPDTPLRTGISKLSQGGSGLKNLSEQRNLKKLSKKQQSQLEDCKRDKNSNRGLIESLTNLEEEYEKMRSLSKENRRSIKRSLVNIKGVPHTTITLKPRYSAMKINRSTLSLHSTQSQNTSFSLTQGAFKVVSIGSLCQQRKPKKKGIQISLLSTLKRREKCL